MLIVGIIGYGGIAQAVHVPAYEILEEKGKARLVATCDIDPGQFSKKLEINLGSAESGSQELHTYIDMEEMLSKEQIDMIDICLPTYLHAQYAIDMLNRGYHVMSEKPMARTSGECEALLRAAKTAKGKLMIGQCLRFSAEYLFLKDAIQNDAFGKPVSAVFRRQSTPPAWSWENWMMDYAKSGSCLLDLHIHDIDIARFLFGEPEAVSCVTGSVYIGDDIVHSRLMYKDLAVLAIGDWSQQGVPFSADYRVGFEKATIICEGGAVTVYPREGEAWKPTLSNDSMYMKEIEYLIDMVTGGLENTQNPPESASATVRLIETLKASADENGKIIRI